MGFTLIGVRLERQERMIRSLARSLAKNALDGSTVKQRGTDAVYQDVALLGVGDVVGNIISFPVGANFAEFDPMSTRIDFDAEFPLEVVVLDGSAVVKAKGELLPQVIYV